MPIFITHTPAAAPLLTHSSREGVILQESCHHLRWLSAYVERNGVSGYEQQGQLAGEMAELLATKVQLMGLSAGPRQGGPKTGVGLLASEADDRAAGVHSRDQRAQ